MTIVGNTKKLLVEFRNESNALFDPDTVTVKYRCTGGALQTFTYPADSEIIKSATGKYHHYCYLDMAGDWDYRWEGSGSLAAASEGRFKVDSSKF